jgi:hypothetical protein
MTLVFADRVKESTTSTGTGPLTLGSAESGFRAFSSVCVDGDTAYYCVTDGTSWEVGLGTFAAGVLSRTSVLSSSNGGALVALNPGPKDVFLTVPASVVTPLPYFADGAAPAAGTVEGQEWFDTDQNNLLHIWHGGAWIEPAAHDFSARSNIGVLQGQVASLLGTAVSIGPTDPVTAGFPDPPGAMIWLDRSAAYARYVFDPFDATWHTF